MACSLVKCHRMESISVILNTTTGAYEIGVLVSYMLLGVMTTQTYIYFTRFPDDSWKLKALVAFVWLCEFAHAISIAQTLYVYTIVDYGQPLILLFGRAAPKSISLAVLFSGLITTSVQGFFSLRIYRLSRQLFIPALIVPMTFLRLVGTTIVAVAGLGMTSIESFVAQWGGLLTAVWSIGVASDVTITSTLVVILLRQRRICENMRTGILVDKIIAWTIETGILTTASWIAILTCFVTMKNNFIWVAVFVVNARLFSNSLLASLNSRASLRAINEASSGSLHFTPASVNGVHMTKVIQVTRDDDSNCGLCDDASSAV